MIFRQATRQDYRDIESVVLDAKEDDTVVGVVILSTVAITGNESVTAYILAPLAVLSVQIRSMHPSIGRITGQPLVRDAHPASKR